MQPTIMNWNSLKEVKRITFENLEGEEKKVPSKGAFRVYEEPDGLWCQAFIIVEYENSIDERFVLCNFYSRTGRKIFALPLNLMQMPSKMKFNFKIAGTEVRVGDVITY